MKMQQRGGFTLLESLVALTLLGVIIVSTLAALDRQVKLFSSGASQMDAIQNGRFAMTALEKDLPTTGTNVAPGQPFLVYADTHVVVFNADYLSNINNDPSAVYIDTAAADEYSTAVTRARRFTIPRTLVQYPDSNYRVGGSNSRAETIIFYFEPDTLTARTDDYLLIRKVNDQAGDLLARGVLRQPGLPFFQYQRRVTPLSGNPYLQLMSATNLPLRHTRAVHGAADDTAQYAVIDNLRAVVVNYAVSDLGPGGAERRYNISRTITLPNAGTASRSTCGDEPILGAVAFTATATGPAGGRFVRLSWNRAMDESSGERDVINYVLFRQTAAGPVSDPFLSIPAGQATYVYDDLDVKTGVTYWYAIAAQDCTPALSDVTSIPPVTP